MSIARIATVVGLCCIPVVTNAADVAWAFYGAAKIEGEGADFCFYDAKSIDPRPNKFIRFWTKCMPKAEMDAKVAELRDEVKTAMEAKMAAKSMPPITTIQKLNADQAINVIIYEILADLGKTAASARVLYELDCDERRMRDLSVSTRTTTQDKIGDWSFISPEGNGATLLKLLCQK